MAASLTTAVRAAISTGDSFTRITSPRKKLEETNERIRMERLNHFIAKSYNEKRNDFAKRDVTTK